MKKIIAIPLILLLAFMDNSVFPRTGYIRMQFQGVYDKPHTTVIFYLKGSIDTAYEDFVKNFEVTPSEFHAFTLTTIMSRLGIKS